MQGHVGVGSFVERINFATGIRMGIDVNAGGALIEFGKIKHLMHRLFALNRAGMIVIHVIGDAGRDAASAARVILIFDAKILDAQFADGHGHPAVLPAMIVNPADLADFPADGKDFEEGTLEDEISRVVAFGVEKIGLERVNAELIVLKILLNFREREILVMNFGKAVHPFIDRQLRHSGLLSSEAAAEPKYSASARDRR